MNLTSGISHFAPLENHHQLPFIQYINSSWAGCIYNAQKVFEDGLQHTQDKFME